MKNSCFPAKRKIRRALLFRFENLLHSNWPCPHLRCFKNRGLGQRVWRRCVALLRPVKGGSLWRALSDHHGCSAMQDLSLTNGDFLKAICSPETVATSLNFLYLLTCKYICLPCTRRGFYLTHDFGTWCIYHLIWYLILWVMQISQILPGIP